MLAAIVDPKVLGDIVLFGALAGIGVSALFGLAIVGGTRSHDARRDGLKVRAALFGALGALSLAAFLGAVGYGLVLVFSK